MTEESFNHGGMIYHQAKQMGVHPTNVLDFSANINPLGPPVSVTTAIQRALPMIVHYPDSTQSEVKNTLADYFGLRSSHFLIGNGASEIIDLLFKALNPKRIVVFEPAFSEYKRAAKRHGIPVLQVPLWKTQDNLWRVQGKSAPNPTELYNYEMLKQSLRRYTLVLRTGDVVVLNIPHNPTGLCFHLDSWYLLAQEWMQQGVRVIVDESFLDFLSDETRYTAIPKATDSESLFVVRSATKFYAIPGLRFGFAIGSSTLFQKIERYRDGWSVNQLAQVAASAAYKDREFQRQTHQWLETERAHVVRLWEAHPKLTLYMGKVNFFLLHFKNTELGSQVEEFLRTRNIMIRNCRNFEGLGASFYRVAIRTHNENEILYKAITDYLDGCK
ncbi:threonine-phosphate decarboxylase CobD [Alicyclobacillus sp. SO9]|uniref:threonine-phosphate decarboxylase CobD n=1 Tax=Alicyclobacillus sp. SO9 TaxID=2665646 RepID=UPI0018E831FE|nr:threonine-phosphate decarboxylase CobD [Alicyclobacillus sp. SO9]QQE79688.1 threonine-phosphate decarboxylase [Alicyclobacillus sp. SO9]